MNFSTKNIAAARVSNMVTINHVEYNKSIRSILAYCSDNNTRTCRIDRCESLPAARLLYKETKALVGMSAFFYAAGGNDPSRWFFAVEGVNPVRDDTPEYIHGMRVDEPDYEDEYDLSDEELGMPYKDAISHIKPSEITQVDEHTVQLTGQALLDYLAFRFPKEVEAVAEIETAEKNLIAYLYEVQADIGGIISTRSMDELSGPGDCNSRATTLRVMETETFASVVYHSNWDGSPMLEVIYGSDDYRYTGSEQELRCFLSEGFGNHMTKLEAAELAAELDEVVYESQRQAVSDYGPISPEEQAEDDMEMALAQAEAEAELDAEQEVLDSIERDEVIAFEQFHADWCEAIEMETAEEGAMSALAQHEAEVDIVVTASIEVTWLLVRYDFLFTEGNQTWADWAQLRHDLVMAKHTLESNNDYELSNTIEEKLGNIKFIINDIEAKTLLLELEAQR